MCIKQEEGAGDRDVLGKQDGLYLLAEIAVKNNRCHEGKPRQQQCGDAGLEPGENREAADDFERDYRG